jgi:hypothetical protein
MQVNGRDSISSSLSSSHAVLGFCQAPTILRGQRHRVSLGLTTPAAAAVPSALAAAAPPSRGESNAGMVHHRANSIPQNDAALVISKNKTECPSFPSSNGRDVDVSPFSSPDPSVAKPRRFRTRGVCWAGSTPISHSRSVSAASFLSAPAAQPPAAHTPDTP